MDLLELGGVVLIVKIGCPNSLGECPDSIEGCLNSYALYISVYNGIGLYTLPGPS